MGKIIAKYLLVGLIICGLIVWHDICKYRLITDKKARYNYLANEDIYKGIFICLFVWPVLVPFFVMEGPGMIAEHFKEKKKELDE